MGTKVDLVIDQGTTYSNTFFLTDANGDPVNLTGYTANAMLREWYTSKKSIAFGTSINANAGAVTVTLSSTVTQQLWPKRYVYDIKLTDGSNNASRPYEGIVTVTPAATK